jgi:hypothetical protein
MSALLASTVSEHYEIWVPDVGAWALKSLFRDFNVAWVVACARAGPVRIVRAIYENGKQVERKVVAELRVAHGRAEDPAEEGYSRAEEAPLSEPRPRSS